MTITIVISPLEYGFFLANLAATVLEISGAPEPVQETPKIQNVHTAISFADVGTQVKRHIARLGWLLGTGKPVPPTVPADEIEQAKSYLLSIGIAAPFTARNQNVFSPIGAGGKRGKSAGGPPRKRVTPRIMRSAH